MIDVEYTYDIYKAIQFHFALRAFVPPKDVWGIRFA
jgi:hypothetical protein